MITLLEFLQKRHIDIDVETVDLDLPSGTLWASCNLGANRPEDVGDYYAWGEIKSKKYFESDNYEFYKDGVLLKYNKDDNKLDLDLEDDAAYMQSYKQMKIPTVKQFWELLDNSTINFYDDYIELTSKINGKKLIFPNSKVYIENNIRSDCSICLWVNERSLKYDADALGLNFDKKWGNDIKSVYRSFGLNIRPVKV